MKWLSLACALAGSVPAMASWSDFAACVQNASMTPTPPPGAPPITVTLQDVQVYHNPTSITVQGWVYWNQAQYFLCSGGESVPQGYTGNSSAPSPRYPARTCGSVVDVDDKTLGEHVPVAGASFDLVYNSRWTASISPKYTVNIPLSGPNPSSSTNSFLVKVKILGQVLTTQTISNSANLIFSYQWNGLDSSGNLVLGSVVPETTFQVNGSGYAIPWPEPIGGF